MTYIMRRKYLHKGDNFMEDLKVIPNFEEKGDSMRVKYE